MIPRICVSKQIFRLKPQGQARSPASSPTGAPPRETHEPIRLDLETAPLILAEVSEWRARVRQDLKEICGCISACMPESSILLTGSLSVGEGRCAAVESAGPGSLESDYDLVVVTPSFLHSLPPVADRNLRPLLGNQRFAAVQEITLVWKPLLALGMTTTAGKVVSHGRFAAGLLENLRAPRAAGALQGAYCHLAAFPLAPAGARATLLSKACVKAFRAFFLERFAAAPRRLWVRLSSIRFILETVAADGHSFSSRDRDCLRRAGAHLLHQKMAEWDPEDYVALKSLLDRIRRLTHRPLGRRHAFKHAAWILANRAGVRRLFARAPDCLQALELLVAAWGVAETPLLEPLMAAGREVARISPGHLAAEENDPKRLYAQLFAVLNRYVSYYPNKLYYPGCSPCGPR